MPTGLFHPQADQRYDDPVIQAYKKDVDVTLIQACLKLTAEQRLINLENALADLLSLRRAMKIAMQGKNQ